MVTSGKQLLTIEIEMRLIWSKHFKLFVKPNIALFGKTASSPNFFLVQFLHILHFATV